MDKETLIRLAQPIATALLAISIFSIPSMTKAGIESAISLGSLSVYITNASSVGN